MIPTQALDKQEISTVPNPSSRDKTARDLWLVIAGLTALYLIVVAIGNRRYVWFDELFTFDIARSGSLKELWYRVLQFRLQPTHWLRSQSHLHVPLRGDSLWASFPVDG